MKLIIGLGNPGKQYEKTRHNVGFIVIDEVARSLGVSLTTKKFKALLGETFVKGEKIIFAKPQTYMNLSGESVIQIMNYYNLSEEDIFVVCDDLDLELGKIRIRTKGSSGGQKGVQNIIDHLKTKEFIRLKVGVGNNKQIDTKDYVLGKLDKNTPVGEAANCVEDFINGMDILTLMNKYN